MIQRKRLDKQIRQKKAVALRYDKDRDASPKIIGKGAGLLSGACPRA